MVSAVVPCYGDVDVVTRALPLLLESTAVELEVVLVNNDERQAESVRALVESTDDSRVRMLELAHGAGFARAVNAGIDASSGELVFFANSDLFVEPTYLEVLTAFFVRQPRAGAACGKIFRFDPVLGKTRVLDTTGHTIGRDRGAVDRGGNDVDVGQFETEEQVFGISGAALVARREALQSVQLGGEYLDETFGMYKEDVDLSWRLRLAGWENWYVPSAVAYHLRTSQAPSRGVRAFHRNERTKPRHVRVHSLKNQWLMLVKNEDAANLLRHLPFIASREAFLLGYNTLTAPRVTGSAIRGFARSLPAARESRRAIAATRKVGPAAIRRWFEGRTQLSGVARRRQPG